MSLSHRKQLTLLQMSRIMSSRSMGSLTGVMRCRTALPALPTRHTCTPARGSDSAEPLSQLVLTRRVYTVLLLGLPVPAWRQKGLVGGGGAFKSRLLDRHAGEGSRTTHLLSRFSSGQQLLRYQPLSARAATAVGPI